MSNFSAGSLTKAPFQFEAGKYKAGFHESPMLVFYEVTQACGLVCKHCRACAQTCSHPDELSTKLSLQLIEQLATFPQPPMLVFTGGDPFCRNDIFQLIEHARKVGLEASITPSATSLVTPEAVQRLKDLGIHRMAISIDGADAETHDKVRGVPGSFSRSLDILNNARQIGLATQINTTVTPGNLDQLDAMAHLFEPLEIDMWSVFFLVPVGRADNAPRLSGSQCEEAFGKLWEQSQRRRFRIKTTEAPHYRRYQVQMQKKRRAEAAATNGTSLKPPASTTDKLAAQFLRLGINDGKGILFVGHTGEVYPSGFMPLSCGTYPQKNIVNIYQNSPTLKDLRDPNRLEGKCGQCSYRTICGGSRARTYALTGNPFAEEPDCEHQPSGKE